MIFGKHCLAVLVLAAGALSGGVVLAADSTTISEITVSLPITNPCNGEAATVTGPFRTVFHVNATNSGFHLRISATTHLVGPGSLGNNYDLPSSGGGQFDVTTVDGTYITPFHAVVVSEGNAPNYLVDGIDNWMVSGGTLFFSGFTVTGVTCTP